jgi:hypothetical protein
MWVEPVQVTRFQVGEKQFDTQEQAERHIARTMLTEAIDPYVYGYDAQLDAAEFVGDPDALRKLQEALSVLGLGWDACSCGRAVEPNGKYCCVPEVVTVKRKAREELRGALGAPEHYAWEDLIMCAQGKIARLEEYEREAGEGTNAG